MNKLNKAEALKAMIDGAKVQNIISRHSAYNSYIFFDGMHFKFYSDHRKCIEDISSCLDHDEYYIYEEKKELVSNIEFIVEDITRNIREKFSSFLEASRFAKGNVGEFTITKVYTTQEK
mgnify:CR=1 FL=1